MKLDSKEYPFIVKSAAEFPVVPSREAKHLQQFWTPDHVFRTINVVILGSFYKAAERKDGHFQLQSHLGTSSFENYTPCP